MDIDETARCLEALGHPTRLAVYRRLVRAGEDGLPVGTLQADTEVPASTLSHHLRRLIQVDLISQERRGASLICRANYPVMKGVIDFLTAECCADSRCSDAA